MLLRRSWGWRRRRRGLRGLEDDKRKLSCLLNSGALGLAQLLASFLFGVSGRDPLTMIVAAGALGLVAIAACILPVRRATEIDPMIALKSE